MSEPHPFDNLDLTWLQPPDLVAIYEKLPTKFKLLPGSLVKMWAGDDDAPLFGIVLSTTTTDGWDGDAVVSAPRYPDLDIWKDKNVGAPPGGMIRTLRVRYLSYIF